MAQVTARIIIYKIAEKLSSWTDFIVDERLDVLNLVLLVSIGCAFLLMTAVVLFEKLCGKTFALCMHQLVQFFDPGGLMTDVKPPVVEDSFFCMSSNSSSVDGKFHHHQTQVSASATWLNVILRWIFLHFSDITDSMNTWLLALNVELTKRTRIKKERLSLRFEKMLPLRQPPVVSDIHVASSESNPDFTTELDVYFEELNFIVSLFQEDSWPKRQLVCDTRVQNLQGRLYVTLHRCPTTIVVKIRFLGKPSMNILLAPQDACAELEFKTIELMWMRERICEALMKGVTEVILGPSLTQEPESMFSLLLPSNISPSASHSSSTGAPAGKDSISSTLIPPHPVGVPVGPAMTSVPTSQGGTAPRDDALSYLRDMLFSQRLERMTANHTVLGQQPASSTGPTMAHVRRLHQHNNGINGVNGSATTSNNSDHGTFSMSGGRLLPNKTSGHTLSQ